jgi:predicted nuclease of predicted toxin-antitoxin system
MGTLSEELTGHAERLSSRPRIYADANVPARLVTHMRARLHWDVLFVLEEEGLRRAPDATHYRLARQLRRTLVTMDRDYLDDRRFPPEETVGVLVIQAPDERQLALLVDRIDRALFQPAGVEAAPADRGSSRLPVAGRKLHLHTDWSGEL